MSNEPQTEKGSRIARVVLVCIMCSLFWSAWREISNNEDYATALLNVGLGLLGLWSIGFYSDLKTLYRRIRKSDEVDEQA
ncbi:MAG: hypothetical protein OXG15_15315 [Gammaproteobacteria bacterium]|nr:hypothetical protein [Gammaproteobacteria bacterium]